MRTVPPTEKGKYKAFASGAITNGKPVVVNSAGTVSVVNGSNLTTENYGSNITSNILECSTNTGDCTCNMDVQKSHGRG